MKPIIRVENLGKQYTIGDVRATNKSLRETISESFRSPFKSLRKTSESNSFWALKDVNFEINEGEVIGIIGRNGAGKSTLLKVLSRITEPTKGRVELYGRVASLLEVGTGFHGELTGRENIFLNGAILGMKRFEIAAKLDEIIDFAGIEKFIDTPVKHYSSGMYVRLAFAVAAHLEPEILIVDEVLAVGDAEFQKKCLGKMDAVSKTGRTILFVSHQMGTIAQLCKRTIVLEGGELVFQGETFQAIDFYSNNRNHSKELRQDANKNDEFQFLNVYNCDESLNPKSEFRYDQPITLFTEIYTPRAPNDLEFAVSLYDRQKRRVFTIHEPLTQYYDGSDRIKLVTTIPANFITPGNFSWLMCVNLPMVKATDLQDDICEFTVLDTGSKFAAMEGTDYGCVFANFAPKAIK